MIFESMYLTSKIKLGLMLLKNTDLNKIIKRTITISPNASLLDARQVLLGHNLKRLVVTDSKKHPVGIITEKDIAKTIYALGDKPIKSIKISGFMSKNLLTVKKTDSIYNCAKLMKKNHISSIIVLGNNGILEGLVTKTDLASIFLTHAISPLKISKIMTRNVITAMPGDSLLYVESLLIHNRIARIVIQRNKIPVGIITDRDFAVKIVAHAYQITTPVKQIMSTPLIAIGPDESVWMVADLMYTRGIRKLPVIEDDKVIGIITSTDLVNQLAISTNEDMRKMYHESVIKVYKQHSPYN